MFNESFATAVERLGSARWLATQASATRRAPNTRPLTRGAMRSAPWRWPRASVWPVYAPNQASSPRHLRKPL
jgi:predicted aminopeptidase